MSPLLFPKEVTVETQYSGSKKFVISKVPALVGRELVYMYPVSNIPKVGDYASSRSAMLLMMSYVSVRTESADIRLVTPELVDNHTIDWETLLKLEKLMMEYNCSFFENGVIWTSLIGLIKKAQVWITSMSIPSSASSSPKNSRRGKS